MISIQLNHFIKLFSKLTLITLVYYILARTGLFFVFHPENVAFVWPVSGLGLAVLLLNRRRDWPGVLLAIFVGNTLANVFGGNPILTSLGFAFANCTESFLASWLLIRHLGTPIRFTYVREVVSLVIVAVILSNATTSLLGASISYIGLGSPFWNSWRVWWIADGVGMLLVAPIIVMWASEWRDIISKINRTRFVEIVSVMGSLIALSVYIFGNIPTDSATVPLYLFYPLLIWIALRFRPIGVVTTVFILVLCLVYYMTVNTNTIIVGAQNMGGRVLATQIFISVTMFTTFVLSVVVAERKKSDKELKESEERYRSLYNKTPAMMHSIDNAGKLISASDLWLENLGYTMGEVIGKKSIDFLTEESKKHAIDVDQDFLKKGYATDVSYQFIKKNKEIMDVLLSAWSEKDEEDNVVRSMGVLIDVTDRKKTEIELQKEKDFTEKAIDAQMDTFFVFEIETGKAVRWNERFKEVSGYTDEEIESLKAPNSYYSKEDLEKASISIEKVLTEGYGEIELQFICKDGSLIPTEYHVSLIRDDKDKPKYFISIGRDVRERKRLEEQLQIRQRMDSLGTLAGGIAHDFNNMLVGIMGNIDLLLFDKDPLTETQRERILGAEKSCERAKDLIQQFHTFSKVSISEKTSIDVYDSAKEVTDLLEKTTDKLIAKKIEFEEGVFFINANSTEIHQVLLNLGINAAHAIEQKGVQPGDYISFTAKEYQADSKDIYGLSEGGYIHIIVEDNGIGMSDEIMKKAFDPLFTTKDKGGARGQGLGLAMVFNIVTRLHNGHIYI